jgi:succinate dehydrogenase/fumarate reductase flavoprotein subunit
MKGNEKETAGDISRRGFLSGVAAMGGTALMASALAGCTEPSAQGAEGNSAGGGALPKGVDKWDYEADIVICGAGASGLACAITAFDAGADVLVIEKFDWIGGQMRRSGGALHGAPTSVQKELGVEDTAADFADYMYYCGKDYHISKSRCQAIADASGPNIEWVLDEIGNRERFEVIRAEDKTPAATGLNSLQDMYEQPPGNTIKTPPRSHWFLPLEEYAANAGKWIFTGFKEGMPGGSGMAQGFLDTIESRGIKILTETPLVSIIREPEGPVLGVKADEKGSEICIKAKKGVFLGCGGFRNSQEMLDTYRPGGWVVPGAEPEIDPKTGEPYDTAVFFTTPHVAITPDAEQGEGIKAGMEVGANLWNMAMCDTTVFHCNGGLQITDLAEVIDVHGDIIPRLYAGGANTGGNIGLFYPGCGIYVTVALWGGRTAAGELVALNPLS